MLMKTREADLRRVGRQDGSCGPRCPARNEASSASDAMRWRLGAAPAIALLAAGGLVMVAFGNDAAREGTGGAQPLFWGGLAAIYAPIFIPPALRLRVASGADHAGGAARRFAVRRQDPRRPDRVRPLRRARDMARDQRGTSDRPPAVAQPTDRQHCGLPGPRGRDGIRGPARRSQHLPRRRDRPGTRQVDADGRPVPVPRTDHSISAGGRNRRRRLRVQPQLPLLRRPVRIRVAGADAGRNISPARPQLGRA